MHHKYSTFVGGVITLHMLFMFLQLSTLRSFWVPFFTVVSKGFVMDTNVSLQVSLDGPRDSHLCLCPHPIFAINGTQKAFVCQCADLLECFCSESLGCRLSNLIPLGMHLVYSLVIYVW